MLSTTVHSYEDTSLNHGVVEKAQIVDGVPYKGLMELQRTSSLMILLQFRLVNLSRGSTIPNPSRKKSLIEFNSWQLHID